MATVPEDQRTSTAALDAERSLRDAIAINDRLGEAGYSTTEIAQWWQSAAYEELDSQTPIRVWQRCDYVRVQRLVDALMQRELDTDSGVWRNAVPADAVLAGLRKKMDTAR